MYTYPTVQRYTRPNSLSVQTASKHINHIPANEFLGAGKEHTFARTACLVRGRAVEKLMSGGVNGRKRLRQIQSWGKCLAAVGVGGGGD